MSSLSFARKSVGKNAKQVSMRVLLQAWHARGEAASAKGEEVRKRYNHSNCRLT